MSGIRTLADLRERCRIDEFTDCWLWGGAMSDGVPRAWSAAHGKTINCGRFAWELSAGKAPPKGLTVYRAMCCPSNCINPKHLKVGTKADNGAAVHASGHLRGDPIRTMCNRRNGQKTSRGTPELRALILASDEPGLHLAPKLGLSHAVISNVRRGKRWNGLAGSSVFTQWRRAA